MQTPALAFRLTPARRGQQLQQFDARDEILWFGFRGAFSEPGTAALAFQAHVVRSARHFGFAEGFLSNGAEPSAPHLAVAIAMVAPAR